MKVSTEKLPESQVKVEVEVEAERVERSIDAAYRRLAPRVKVAGFRPGKAPRVMVERQLGGREALLQEALDRLVPEVYDEVIEQESIEAIDLPRVSITSLEPVTFTATVPIRPAVNLGDYKSLRVDHEPIDVPEEQVAATIERLRHSQATLEPVDRPVQMGDVIRANVSAAIEGAEQFSQQDAEFPIREGVEVSLPGFTAELPGLTRGVEKRFSLAVPDDYSEESVRGKQIDYTVTVNEVKEEKLPELDDDFAAGVGKGYESIAALQDEIRSDIRNELERQERSRYEMKALDQLLPLAELEYPPVLVERELDHLMSDHSGGRSADVTDQIERFGKSEEEVKADLRPQAEERVRKSLILGELTNLEDITVSDEDIEAELSRLTEGAGESAPQLRQIFENENGRGTLQRSLLTRKTFERLVQIAEGPGNGQSGEPQPEVVSPSAARKSRNKATKQAEQESAVETTSSTATASETETT